MDVVNEVQAEVEKREEKVKKWFNDPYNITLAFIILAAAVIRIYFFIVTKNQPLWWDEAEYMATAKHWATGVMYMLNPQRPPLFQALAALSFIVGLGEIFIKFVFVLLPSTALVGTIYFLGKEMYDKKIGLIAAFFATVSWTFLFWTERVQPDSFSMLFQTLAILFMWKYWKGNITKHAIIAGIFAAAGFYFKVSALLVPIAFMIFIFMKDRGSAFKNKGYYYFAIAFLLTLVPYFIWAYATFGDPLAFRANYSNAIGTPTPFGWYNLQFYYTLTENLLFILFIFGLLISMKFLLYADVLLKNKEKNFDPGIFSIIIFILTSAFYIFYIRGTEDRWVFLWMPFIFFMASNALIFVKDQIKKYNKAIAVILVIAILAFVAYSQLNHTSQLIDNKKNTYAEVKDAGLWMKAHSSPTDIITTSSSTQTVYYAERGVVSYDGDLYYNNQSAFTSFVMKDKPKFIEVSAFEHSPTWMNDWLNINRQNVVPVQAYFADQAQKQPILIIYQINYNNSTFYSSKDNS